MALIDYRNLPETPRRIVEEVAAYLDIEPWRIIVGDHEHGDVRKIGAYSLAMEGCGNWSWRFSERTYRAYVENRNGPRFPGWFIEPVASWCLGIYPVGK